MAVLCEPWAGNPFARLARLWLPYSGKGHTPDEDALGPRDVRRLADIFRSVEVDGYQVLGALRRALPLGATLDRADRLIFRLFPALRRLGRYVVLTLRK